MKKRRDEIFKRISEIDQNLSVTGIEINQRLIRAMIEYQKLYNINFILFGKDADLCEDRKYICEWYCLTYGKLQNTKTSSYMVIIKNNPYEIYIPIIFGTFSVHWKFFLQLKYLDMYYKIDKLDYYSNISIRNLIIGLTDFTESQLAKNDINDIMLFVQKIIDIDLFFYKYGNNNSIKIARNDLIASKNFMLNTKNYDMVAWQCLQCVEKLLKEYIVIYKKTTPAKIHILDKLAEKAEITDSEILEHLNLIKSTPSSRYELKDSLNDAVNNYINTIIFIHKFIKLWI